MRRQTRKPSPQKMRKRKYMVRRVTVLILLAAVITGLVFLAKALFSGTIGANNRNNEPTPTPEQTPVAPTPAPKPTFTPELDSTLGVDGSAAPAPSSLGFASQLYVRRDAVSYYNREEPIYFPRSDFYTSLAGITTYGGNNFRSSFAYGGVGKIDGTLDLAWQKGIGTLDCGEDGVWSGTGWTGMPLMVKWQNDVRQTLGVYDEFKAKEGLIEVIYPTMDGKIYFMELNTGKETRQPIDLGVVNKGTAALDPRGYPILYIGQGVQSTSEEGTYGAWFRIISLVDNTVIYSFGGRDPASNRKWQAYDSSPLLAAEADTLVVGGENGLFYTLKLNTAYDAAAGTLSMEPEKLVKYSYQFSGYADSDTARWFGMESSVAAWHNFAFFTDNGGMLQCVDMNTMSLVYALDIDGDGDAGVAMEESTQDNTIYIYAATKADGRAAQNGRDNAQIMKINGRSGEIKWKKTFDASADNSGGVYAPVHIGQGGSDMENIIVASSANVALAGKTTGGEPNAGEAQNGENGENSTENTVPAGDGGILLALDKQTGRELWRVEQSEGMWSAPVVIYDENQKGYILQCDRGGLLKLYEGISGKELANINLGSRIESTPSVFNNMLVVGTRGVGGNGEGARISCIRIG